MLKFPWRRARYNSTMGLWETCKADFEADGTLRDILIRNTTLADWNTFLDFIRQGKYRWSYRYDHDIADLPENAAWFFNHRETNLTMQLTLWLGEIQINGHFFSPMDIELDMDPRELNSEIQFQQLQQFMQDVGNTLNKDVLLTYENMPDCPILRYKSQHQQFQRITHASG